jgi:hypothetical protein
MIAFIPVNWLNKTTNTAKIIGILYIDVNRYSLAHHHF